MSRTPKDIEIMCMALLKSVIQSGAPSSEWQARTLQAARVHVRIVDKVESGLSGKGK